VAKDFIVGAPSATLSNVRLKLTIAYDGRPFGGWQIQPNALTIQELIESALAEVAKEPLRLHGSGRTDAGVHAAGQVAHFDPPGTLTMNPVNWVAALNTKLPATIRILHCEEVSDDFHARFAACSKTYTYDLALTPILPPLLAGLAWHLPRQLDPETLDEALSLLRGSHDFRAFAANRGNETEDTNYRRTITEASFLPTEHGYRLTFTGDGFLYKMVRLLTGAAVHAAQGRLRLDDLADLLDQPVSLPHGKSPLCAPPDGLSLLEVHYS
jgi:tRNA pseudouridine38-40 synthase